MCFLPAALGLPAGAQRNLRGSLRISSAARRLLELQEEQTGCRGFGILSTKFYYFYPALLRKITAGSPAKAATEICSKDIKPHGLENKVLYFNKT